MVGIVAYVVLILFLRISGKRTLSKMNAFDFIVTIALGSTLATVMLNKEIALAEASLAFALLIGLQFVVTWTSVRIRWVKKLVTGEPSMLVYRGEFLSEALRTTRVTEEEVRAAVRSSGIADIAEVEAVVLVTEGSLSVIRRNENGESTSLAGVGIPTYGRGPLDNGD